MFGSIGSLTNQSLLREEHLRNQKQKTTSKIKIKKQKQNLVVEKSYRTYSRQCVVKTLLNLFVDESA